MPFVRAKNEHYILNDTLHVIIPHLGTRLHFVAKECCPVFRHCKAWWLCLKTYSVQHTRTNSTTYLTSKGGGAFFWKNFFSQLGGPGWDRISSFFSKNYYWWLPWERKSKNKGAKQRTHCCAQVVNFSLKSNSRLVIASTYRLLKSIYCTVGNYLTFHHLLTLFPSVQGVLLQSYQSILPSLPSWASACHPPPVSPEEPLFRAVHSPLPPSKWFG